MNPQTLLITYATPEYSRAAKLLTVSARLCGVRSNITYTRGELERSEFYRQHKEILDAPRGAGYWLWKPYFIAETLRKLKENDLLIYTDAGILFRKNIQPLLDLVKGEDDVALFYNAIRAGHYTKRDVFVALGCDSDSYREAPMVHAGLQVYRKTNASLAFAEEVLHYCTMDRLITDDPNVLGFPDPEGFRENRHDQSILTLIAHKHRRKISADPSQFLVRKADYRFGTGDIPHAVLPYRRIVYIHRYKNNDIWKLFTDVTKKVFSRS